MGLLVRVVRVVRVMRGLAGSWRRASANATNAINWNGLRKTRRIFPTSSIRYGSFLPILERLSHLKFDNIGIINYHQIPLANFGSCLHV